MISGRVFGLLLLIGGAGVAGCATPDAWQKIHVDLSGLNDAGLHGPPDGLRALSYAFCRAHRRMFF